MTNVIRDLLFTLTIYIFKKKHCNDLQTHLASETKFNRQFHTQTVKSNKISVQRNMKKCTVRIFITLPVIVTPFIQ